MQEFSCSRTTEHEISWRKLLFFNIFFSDKPNNKEDKRKTPFNFLIAKKRYGKGRDENPLAELDPNLLKDWFIFVYTILSLMAKSMEGMIYWSGNIDWSFAKKRFTASYWSRIGRLMWPRYQRLRNTHPEARQLSMNSPPQKIISLIFTRPKYLQQKVHRVKEEAIRIR